MRILIFLIFISFFSLTSFAAKPKGFRCYSLPGGPPPTAFEYVGGNCGGVDSKKMAEALNKDGTRDLLCTVVAGCEVSEEGKPPPPDRKEHEILYLVNNRVLKMSWLVCKGSGTYYNGKLNGPPTCPNPSECQANTFYGGDYATHDPQLGTPIDVDLDPNSPDTVK